MKHRKDKPYRAYRCAYNLAKECYIAENGKKLSPYPIEHINSSTLADVLRDKPAFIDEDLTLRGFLRIVTLLFRMAFLHRRTGGRPFLCGFIDHPRS